MTRRELEVTDQNEIQHILNESKLLHLGLIDDNMPYVVPMNYGYTMENGTLTIYVHGATTGHKLDVIRKNPTCCFEIECDVQPFKGELPCQYGTAYACLMGRGTAVIVDDVKEKQEAMTILMKTQTGEDFTFNEALVSIVSVIRIDVNEYTAKKRPLPKVLQENGECSIAHF